MSYILTHSEDNSPFTLVRVSNPTVNHPDTISNAPWLTYNGTTDVLSVANTDAYFECSMSINRSAAAGIVTIGLDPNDTSDTHTWAQIIVAGGGGGSVYARGDDTAYSVASTSKVEYHYLPTNITYIKERSKMIVKRL